LRDGEKMKFARRIGGTNPITWGHWRNPRQQQCIHPHCCRTFRQIRYTVPLFYWKL
jgi:hypothetical protein